MSDLIPVRSSPSGDVLIYQTQDGRTRLHVEFEGDTAWLTQAQMAELFQTSVPNINIHLRNLFAEGELQQDSVIKQSLITAADSKQYTTKLYNLDVIISVGYRVKSQRGTQFRIWATQRLREYIVKGFTMDDERLKNPPGKGHKDYFDELLERIRDIRSSERRFYQKVLDIFATSIDYSADAEVSHQFFAVVQNKMHWAAHGHTAAEIIHERADSTLPFMGLKTTRPGGIIRKEDVSVAKNYLDETELQILNRVVTLYLDYAELQALDRKPMTMERWISKLDEVLKLAGRDLLDNPGKISAEAAKEKAELHYARYRQIIDALPQPVDADFEAAVRELKKLPASREKKKKS